MPLDGRGALVTLLTYALAAFAEISGCFAFWAWLKLGKSPAWAVPGTAALLLFAFFLTRIPSDTAGRAYAAYGGVYIVASVAWMRLVEGRAADRWDVLGGVVCLVGALIILFGPRGSLPPG